MSSCKRIVNDQKGQAIILMTLTLGVMAMLVGLAVDGARVYLTRQRLAQTVDAAAGVGAKHWRDSDHSLAIAKACDAARLNDMTVAGPAGTCPPEISVSVEDLTSPDGSIKTGLVVTASKAMHTSFMRVGTLLGCGGACEQVNVTARAAAIGMEPPCVYALNPTAAGALSLLGTGELFVPTCGIYVGSDDSVALNTNGASTVDALSIEVVGGVANPGAITPAPRTGAGSRGDPLRNLPEPTAPAGGCDTQPAGPNKSFTPGHYCTINLTSGTATFAPGEYYIENDFNIIGNATASGTDVHFFLASGAININGTGSVNFTAIETTAYAGLTFFQSRTNTTNAVLSGSNTFHIEGAYLPSAHLQLSGGSCGSPMKGLIVADTITIAGSTCITKPDELPAGVRNQAILVGI